MKSLCIKWAVHGSNMRRRCNGRLLFPCCLQQKDVEGMAYIGKRSIKHWSRSTTYIYLGLV